MCSRRVAVIHSVFFFVFFFFFFVATSNFGAEAERSYIFCDLRLKTFLKMFLNYMVYTIFISVNQCGRDQETYQSALPAEIWYQRPCPGNLL